MPNKMNTCGYILIVAWIFIVLNSLKCNKPQINEFSCLLSVYPMKTTSSLKVKVIQLLGYNYLRYLEYSKANFQWFNLRSDMHAYNINVKSKK